MSQAVAWPAFILAFIPLFVAVDPFGLLPIFVGLTRKLNAHERKKAIRESLATALGVAVVFLFVGRYLLQVVGVTVGDFMVAGGLLLFVLAVLEVVTPKGAIGVIADDFGVVPLGVPLIVGPAVLATLLLLSSSYGVVATLIGLVLNIVLVGVMFLGADTLMKWLGEGGAKVISKIAGLLIAAIAVMLVRRGIAFFGWLKVPS